MNKQYTTKPAFIIATPVISSFGAEIIMQFFICPKPVEVKFPYAFLLHLHNQNAYLSWHPNHKIAETHQY